MCDTRHFKQQTIISAPPHSIKLSKGTQVLLDLPVLTCRKPTVRAALARSTAQLPQHNKKKLALPHNKKSGGKNGVSNSVKSISGMMANCPVVSKDFLSLNRTTDLEIITLSELQSTSSHLLNSTDLECEVDAVNLSGRISDDDASGPATVARDGDSNMSLSSAFCRICHGGGSASSSAHGLGSLSSPCDCRGTVAMVHISCLERWLSESGKSTCELCSYQYDTRRVHKYGAMLSLFLWITSVNYNQFVLDVMGIVAMTPFAVFSAYVMGQSLGVLIHHATQETPWTIATAFIFGCLSLIGYYCWIISAATRNALGWWMWHITNYDVHLIRPDSEVPSVISPSKSTASNEAIDSPPATRPPSPSDRG